MVLYSHFTLHKLFRGGGLWDSILTARQFTNTLTNSRRAVRWNSHCKAVNKHFAEGGSHRVMNYSTSIQVYTVERKATPPPPSSLILGTFDQHPNPCRQYALPWTHSRLVRKNADRGSDVGQTSPKLMTMGGGGLPCALYSSLLYAKHCFGWRWVRENDKSLCEVAKVCKAVLLHMW